MSRFALAGLDNHHLSIIVETLLKSQEHLGVVRSDLPDRGLGHCFPVRRRRQS